MNADKAIERTGQPVEIPTGWLGTNDAQLPADPDKGLPSDRQNARLLGPTTLALDLRGEAQVGALQTETFSSR